jgi:hypothetical protein
MASIETTGGGVMTLADLTPGMRVIVQSPEWLSGQVGTVLDMTRSLLNGNDCAVVFADGDVMCFMACDLAVAS